MRKTLLLLVALFICATSNAQIAKWMIKPQYDSITINNVGLLEVRLDNKVGLYDRNGNVLVPIEYDRISPFNEGYAMLYIDDRFVGFTNEQGKVVDLASKNYILREGADCFSHGHLLVSVQHGDKTTYGYITTTGEFTGESYLYAHPYFDGYAAVTRALDYRDLSKVKYDLIDTDGRPININEDKYPNIQFMSSFRDSVAVVISRNRFYTITNTNTNPVPIHTDSILDNKKSLVTLDHNAFELLSYPNNKFHISAKNGDFVLNSNLQLEAYVFDNNSPVYLPEKEVETRVAPGSVFSVIAGEHLYGISYDGHELLPPQFEGITAVEDNFAIVLKDGKYGIITVDPTTNFAFNIEKGQTIAFRHESSEVKLTAELPKYIPEDGTYINSLSDDCTIHRGTRQSTCNTEGLFIVYDCTLRIPQDLTQDETDHVYKYVVHYDNLTSTVQDVHVMEWYQKYYDVEIKQSSFQWNKINDEIKIEFDVKKYDTIHDTKAYSKDVKVFQVMDDDSHSELDCTEINDYHYSFTLPLKDIKEASKRATEAAEASKRESEAAAVSTQATEVVAVSTQTTETVAVSTQATDAAAVSTQTAEVKDAGEANNGGEADKDNDFSLSFEIHITESGCPTIKCPFVVNFEMPEPPKDGQPKVDTPVTVTVQADEKPKAKAKPKTQPQPQKKTEQPKHELSGKGKNNTFEIINDIESSTGSKK